MIKFQSVRMLLLLTLLLAAIIPAQAQIAFYGIPDVLWQNRTGASTDFQFWTSWLHDKVDDLGLYNVTNAVDQPTAAWQAVATSDFDRDGHADILWRNPSTGANTLWLMQGMQLKSGTTPLSVLGAKSNYEVVGVADFDADGYDDILWRNTAYYHHFVWFMGGGSGSTFKSMSQIVARPVGVGWIASACGDYDADGDADIIFHNTADGRVMFWQMENGQKLAEETVTERQTDGGWKLVAAEHFNRVAELDLLWSNPAGALKIWRMRGAQLLGITQYKSTEPLDFESALPLFGSSWSFAGVTGYTNTIRLTATASSSPAAVNLKWIDGPARVKVERKGPGDADFITAEATVDQNGAAAWRKKSFTDSTVVAGGRYLYRVGGETIQVGVNAVVDDREVNRGRVLLLANSTYAKNAATEIGMYRTMLLRDGWQSGLRTFASAATVPQIRTLVQQEYVANPSLNVVVLLGGVPWPNSGWANPDGHGYRAHPADIIYGDVDGEYTDLLQPGDTTRAGISELHLNNEPHRHNNLIGDGTFDQNHPPGNGLELAVGRIDFSHIPTVAAGRTEPAMFRDYLTRNEAYRSGAPITALPERVVVSFRPNTREMAFHDGIPLAGALYGLGLGKVVIGDAMFDYPAKWAIHDAWGGASTIARSFGDYVSVNEWANPDWAPRVNFLLLKGSFCHDIGYQDNLLKSFIATPHGLVSMWYSAWAALGDPRVSVAMEYLSAGATIGSEFVRTINRIQAPNYFVSPTLFLNLQGDPTLRSVVPQAPGVLYAVGSAPGAITLSWKRSPAQNATYLVERGQGSSSFDMEFTTLGVASGTSFVDANPPMGRKMYRVRAIVPTTTGTGTFSLLSYGSMRASDW